MPTWSKMNRMVAGEMLGMSRGPVMSWCRRKVEEQEARRDFPIEGSRGSPAPSAYTRKERRERKRGRSCCSEEATARLAVVSGGRKKKNEKGRGCRAIRGDRRMGWGVFCIFRFLEFSHWLMWFGSI
ncbi:hypothetical protein JCGZ_16889 [Jatropha curcas]|uniref:Uncharacterized protein n=1 Tax=Jatropha curcas TaxID=180498 RepID=A0A067L5A0_JATCU|nr:hypothetical protein JCGZ_16889 [Jatropha curcas]